jgi:hypothetical protein
VYLFPFLEQLSFFVLFGVYIGSAYKVEIIHRPNNLFYSIGQWLVELFWKFVSQLKSLKDTRTKEMEIKEAKRIKEIKIQEAIALENKRNPYIQRKEVAIVKKVLLDEAIYSRQRQESVESLEELNTSYEELLKLPSDKFHARDLIPAKQIPPLPPPLQPPNEKDKWPGEVFNDDYVTNKLGKPKRASSVRKIDDFDVSLHEHIRAKQKEHRERLAKNKREIESRVRINQRSMSPVHRRSDNDNDYFMK